MSPPWLWNSSVLLPLHFKDTRIIIFPRRIIENWTWLGHIPVTRFVAQPSREFVPVIRQGTSCRHRIYQLGIFRTLQRNDSNILTVEKDLK